MTALLGVWGVLIATEQFLSADVALSVVAILMAYGLAKDTLIWTWRRRPLPFVLGLLALIVALSGDFWWTSKQMTASEARQKQLEKLSQIPQLQNTINQMTANEERADSDRRIQEAKMEQHLTDVANDNKLLKSSIEKKDATIAEIAREQYALNFAPQVTVSTNNTPATLYFVNNGNFSKFKAISWTPNRVPVLRLLGGRWRKRDVGEHHKVSGRIAQTGTKSPLLHSRQNNAGQLL